MSQPGFTAEASLPETRGHYRSDGLAVRDGSDLRPAGIFGGPMASCPVGCYPISIRNCHSDQVSGRVFCLTSTTCVCGAFHPI